MDITRRKITKIAREAGRFTTRLLKPTGIGAAEYDLINLVRQNPGTTQKELSYILSLDKSTVARQVSRLIEKGYITDAINPSDGRSKLLYPTEKAGSIKSSRAHTEALFYEWLLEGLEEQERTEFAALIEKLYVRCKAESELDFIHVTQHVQNDTKEKR